MATEKSLSQPKLSKLRIEFEEQVGRIKESFHDLMPKLLKEKKKLEEMLKYLEDPEDSKDLKEKNIRKEDCLSEIQEIDNLVQMYQKLLQGVLELEYEGGYFNPNAKYSLLEQLINSQLEAVLSVDGNEGDFGQWGEKVLHIIQQHAPEKFSSLDDKAKRELLRMLHSLRKSFVFDYKRTGINSKQGKKLVDALKDFEGKQGKKIFTDEESKLIMRELMEAGLVGRLEVSSFWEKEEISPDFFFFKKISGIYAFVDENSEKLNMIFSYNGKYYIVGATGLLPAKVQLKKGKLFVKSGKDTFVASGLLKNNRIFSWNDFVKEGNKKGGVMVIGNVLHRFVSCNFRIDNNGNGKRLFCEIRFFDSEGKEKIVVFEADKVVNGTANDLHIFLKNGKKIVLYAL